MAATGVDGVMTAGIHGRYNQSEPAEGNLSNPALFAGPHLLPVWQMVEEYLALVEVRMLLSTND